MPKAAERLLTGRTAARNDAKLAASVARDHVTARRSIQVRESRILRASVQWELIIISKRSVFSAASKKYDSFYSFFLSRCNRKEWRLIFRYLLKTGLFEILRDS